MMFINYYYCFSVNNFSNVIKYIHIRDVAFRFSDFDLKTTESYFVIEEIPKNNSRKKNGSVYLKLSQSMYFTIIYTVYI